MIENASRWPPVWNDEELSCHAEAGLRAFIARRLAEPRDRYAFHVQSQRNAVTDLFQALKGIDPHAPDPKTVRAIIHDPRLYESLRYAAGPPISDDDLSVLATETVERITKERLSDCNLVSRILALICTLSDKFRFPWIEERRTATASELRRAIEATAVLHAAQKLQTERRGFGRQVEEMLKMRLEEMGYARMNGPKAIEAPAQYPPPKAFFGETPLYSRKADILIRLPDERLVAVEAKDSGSALNSVKRVLNDTAAKAQHWQNHAGKQIIPVAVLSGVFASSNLRTAQNQGLYLAWLHDLDSFVGWLESQS